MKRAICSYVILIASCCAGSTYAAKSLWGDIDTQTPEQSVEVKGYLPAQQDEPAAPATPATTQPATPTTTKSTKGATTKQATTAGQAATAAADATAAAAQKTTCDILAAAPKLDPSVMKSPAMQDAFRNNSQFVPPQYKSLLNNSEALNNLYTLYRKQYIFTHCR
jgi:hypothetical protein